MPRDNTFSIVGKLYNGDFEKRYTNPVSEKFEEHGFGYDEKNPSIVAAVGGDGTFLRAARENPESEILGLRAESKGASMDLDFRDTDYALEKIKEGEYEILELPKAEMEYRGKKASGLNEVYFFRKTSEFPGANRFRVYKNGRDQYCDIVYGDGCSFVTPFGSTGYNRSYHGPILKGEEGMILTPMAACLLRETENIKGEEVAKYAKPLVLKEDEEINVKIKREVPNVICADNDIISGHILFEKDEKIAFRKSKETSKIIKIGKK